MPAPQPILKLDDNVRRQLNTVLADAQALLAEAVKQREARVPEMESVITRCEDCIERVSAFKAVNFPGKK